MSRSERRQRQHRVVIRVSDTELTDWQHRAESAHVSLAGYGRGAIFATPAPPPRRRRQTVQDGKPLALILGGLGKLGSNVNQMARSTHLGDPPSLDMLCALYQEVRIMRDLLMQALGIGRGDRRDDEAG